MRPIQHTQFPAIWGQLNQDMANAPVVDVQEWQSIQGAPQSRTIELEDISFSLTVPNSLTVLQDQVEPSLPWAEDHFQERISGIPHNPPPSHEWWPFRQRGNEDHLNNYKFSHTYPERFWPKWANHDTDQYGNQIRNSGIRFDYGDLADLVQLLKNRPFTRQAYLPVWFPEDGLATLFDERVPCTLGYHFMRRGSFLKCVYYMRSCDLYRHFRDDVYMAARLLQWIANQLDDVNPGQLIMHISSLHIFEPERERARYEVSKNRSEALTQQAWW